MFTEVAIPVLDQTTESVVLTRWLKSEGDSVRQGDAVCEIETEKATVEVEAGTAGILCKRLIDGGTQVPPRTVVALIATGAETGEIPPDIDPYYRTLKARPQTAAVDTPSPVQNEAPPPSKEVRISPRARRLAEEHHVDVATITGSGPGGRIIEEDVQATIQGQAAAQQLEATSRANRAKVERVSLSWRTIPHFHMSITVDLSHMAMRKAAAGAGITYTDYFILALAQVLPRHPLLNGHWLNDALTTSAVIRLGLVVQTEHGLIIPALRDMRGRSLEDLAAEREQVVQQALSRSLAASALQEPTFTLSNVGAGHIDDFSAIISPPQVAILAVGSIQERVLVVDSMLAIRPVATLTMAADHRAVDGRQAADFLEDLKSALEA